MKSLVAVLLLLVMAGCVEVIGRAPSRPPTQAQLDRAAQADHVICRVVGARVGGEGDALSNTWIMTMTDDGRRLSFYINDQSIVMDANGRYVAWNSLPRLISRRMEIRYVRIHDPSTAWTEPSETDPKGVLLLRFLDWTTGGA